MRRVGGVCCQGDRRQSIGEGKGRERVCRQECRGGGVAVRPLVKVLQPAERKDRKGEGELWEGRGGEGKGGREGGSAL